MSTTDKILGNRDTQFPTVGQPKGMSSKYYTLTDTSTSPATITVKEASPLGNVFDRSVGTIQGNTFSNLKGNSAEDSFFSNQGKRQAINAARASSLEDLDTNSNPWFADGKTKGNPQLAYNEVKKSMHPNTGNNYGTVDGLTAQMKKSAEMKDAAGTRTNFPGGRGINPLVFPVAIRDTTQDVIKFNMMKYSPKPITMGGEGKKFGIGDRKRNDQDIIGSVVLPIPGGIQDNNQVSWGQDEMDAVQAELANIALQGIKRGPGAAVDANLEAAKKVAGNTGEAGTALANQLAGMASGNARLLTRTTGAILNPNMELLFQAPVLRPFSFSFQLAPRSKKEAETVIKIIRFFKQGMAPIRSKSNLFLKSPHTFQLSYKYRRNSKDQEHPYLNKFKECALQGFNVQYTPQGNYATFSDGVMMQYQISMQFTELEPVFNDEYPNDGDRSLGY